MIGRDRLLRRDRSGSAAVEMALVMPFLLALMFGSAELGNYFMNEHSLIKAVRDGSRFAARQDFSNYTACSGSPGGSVVNDTQNVVMNGYLATGSILTPNIQRANVSVTTSCAANVGGQTMLGIYRNRANGAQVVTVSAQVPYRSILGSLGFNGLGMTLNASSEAAVGGI